MISFLLILFHLTNNYSISTALHSSQSGYEYISIQFNSALNSGDQRNESATHSKESPLSVIQHTLTTPTNDHIATSKHLLGNITMSPKETR